MVAGGIALLGDVTTALDILEGYYLARGPYQAVHQDRPMTAILFLSATFRHHPQFGTLLRDSGLERYWAETKTVPDYRRFG